MTTFTYLLFFRPREDGSGVGGSVYWVVETTEKLGWCGGVVTLSLFWGTGMYERGVRWPRKFIGTTNRGLRGFNMKVVVVRGSFIAELKGWLGMLDPMGLFREQKINFHIVPKDIEAGASTDHWNHHASRHGLIEEDLASSGDALKLLLLPKPFSPDFREGWETYRMEYWDKENARRAELRKLVKARQRQVARREGGWLWWTGWRGWRNIRVFSSKSRRQLDLEKLALKEIPSAERLREKRRREEHLRSGSKSRPSSRSATPTPEPDGRHLRRAGEERARRGSSSAGTARRPRKQGASQGGSRLSATETLMRDADASAPPAQRPDHVSRSSQGSEDTEKGSLTPVIADEIKQEPAEA